MSYYFAGGLYKNKEQELEFKIVRKTEGLPYLTKDKNGLLHTAHHSSLYRLSKNGIEAVLVHERNGGRQMSQKKVSLPESLQNELNKVIEEGVFH